MNLKHQNLVLGKKSRRIEDKLLTLLEDEDRVVRESACLSLAHMRCQRAVKHIVDLWYGDFILICICSCPLMQMNANMDTRCKWYKTQLVVL